MYNHQWFPRHTWWIRCLLRGAGRWILSASVLILLTRCNRFGQICHYWGCWGKSHSGFLDWRIRRQGEFVLWFRGLRLYLENGECTLTFEDRLNSHFYLETRWVCAFIRRPGEFAPFYWLDSRHDQQLWVIDLGFGDSLTAILPATA